MLTFSGMINNVNTKKIVSVDHQHPALSVLRSSSWRFEALWIWAGRTHPGKITHVVWAENTHVSKRYPPFWHAATRTRKEDQIPSKVNPNPRAYRNQQLSVGTSSSSALSPFRGENVIQKQTKKYNGIIECWLRMTDCSVRSELTIFCILASPVGCCLWHRLPPLAAVMKWFHWS